MNFSYFKNKKILITGHTGFKGSWLCFWLNKLGAKVYGFSDREYSKPSAFDSMQIKSYLHRDIRGDIFDYDKIQHAINLIKPNIIFHLAAQALVGESIKDPLRTFKTNSIGTLNIAYSLAKFSKPIDLICITSDKVYHNFEWIWGYRENDKLGGKDPYSASKSMAEIGLEALYQTHLKKKPNLKIVIARAGNVIGGGDWSEGRIIPDAIKSWQKLSSVKIRSPYSTRPWQHVLEPLGGYLVLAYWLSKQKKLNNIESFNFGPRHDQNLSVIDLVRNLSSNWKGSKINILKSNSLAKKEAGFLRLNCDKALNTLRWEAQLNINDVIKFTSEWYQNHYSEDKNCIKITNLQIKEYQQKLNKHINE